ncbi:hypothetical protein BJY04DRAFT_230987 [Aspergillus karnatakaensis]|uniref:uncharacterized protein n=1 Tax=Aspergillus karnatakaensis TaxID=1810916 RepID=UPI003CCDD53F
MNSIQLSTVTTTSSLDSSLFESPILLERQHTIAGHLWGYQQQVPKQQLRPYFQYYTEQCRTVLQLHGNSIPIRTHQDVIEISSRIRRDHSRAEINHFLQTHQWTTNEAVSTEITNASIDLAARLLCMLDIGDFENAHSGRDKLRWIEGSLSDFIAEKLPVSISDERDTVKLDGGFNIYSMVRIAGFNVEPTSNLADHLRLRDVDRTISVFHHASFLMANRESTLFPKGLVDETLATLALLFPQGDKSVQRWYRKQDDPEELDDNVLRCGVANRKLGDFKYWHERLVILKTEFDETRPSTIAQWWNDRRDGSQWYPLWVAISLTVFFGLVQSVTGVLQVYKAYHP